LFALFTVTSPFRVFADSAVAVLKITSPKLIISPIKQLIENTYEKENEIRLTVGRHD
jgi:hypothetical protein